MTLRVEQGKGRKDRFAMLSPVLLEHLRVGWRVAHAQGRMGLDPVDALTTRQLNRAIHAAAWAAHIDKRVSMHTLRNYVPFRIMSGNETGLLQFPTLVRRHPRLPSASRDIVCRSYRLFKKPRSWSVGR
jgi:integrase